MGSLPVLNRQSILGHRGGVYWGMGTEGVRREEWKEGNLQPERKISK